MIKPFVTQFGGFPWYLEVYLVAQVVKHLPAMWETRFDPWVGKIPWRRKWQSTPVLLPGKYHCQRSLVGYSPWGGRVRNNLSDFTSTSPSGTSVFKESACNAGDLGSIPGSEISAGEGIVYCLQYFWDSLAQLVKNPPAVWETWVRSLGWEDPLEKGTATHPSILAWRIPHGVAKNRTCLNDLQHSF